mgnify:FL=1
MFLHIQLWIYAYNYVFDLIIMFSRASDMSNYKCYAAARFSGIFRHRTIKLTCRNTYFLSNIFLHRRIFILISTFFLMAGHTLVLLINYFSHKLVCFRRQTPYFLCTRGACVHIVCRIEGNEFGLLFRCTVLSYYQPFGQDQLRNHRFFSHRSAGYPRSGHRYARHRRK